MDLLSIEHPLLKSINNFCCQQLHWEKVRKKTEEKYGFHFTPSTRCDRFARATSVQRSSHHSKKVKTCTSFHLFVYLFRRLIKWTKANAQLRLSQNFHLSSDMRLCDFDWTSSISFHSFFFFYYSCDCPVWYQNMLSTTKRHNATVYQNIICKHLFREHLQLTRLALMANNKTALKIQN